MMMYDVSHVDRRIRIEREGRREKVGRNMGYPEGPVESRSRHSTRYQVGAHDTLSIPHQSKRTQSQAPNLIFSK